jgi:hypothetical protein
MTNSHNTHPNPLYPHLLQVASLINARAGSEAKTKTVNTAESRAADCSGIAEDFLQVSEAITFWHIGSS